MLDHIAVPVSNFQKSKDFYENSLKPIGYEVVMEFENVAGFGANKKPDFWIAQGKPGSDLHVAFHCDSRELVDQFYKAAMAAGGKDNGAPGLREQYHPNYYGAFVIDPDGNNVEAVCHKPY
jgi:catechol 2,3-dioxygenase-like lactoylglutathione lyase family enzyme